ncbi:hypothetical protein WDW89_11810 [Deltaproteobacteria bacterium TL4]
MMMLLKRKWFQMMLLISFMIACFGFFFTLHAQDATFEDLAAQQEEVVEGKDTAYKEGEAYWKLGFFDMSSPRFNSPHPYKQMTNSAAFDEPSTPMTVMRQGEQALCQTDETVEPAVVECQTNETLEQQVVDTLPSFSLERVVPYDVPLVNAFSFMYYHTAFFALDSLVGRLSRDIVSRGSRPLIKMKTYYDMFTVSIHPMGFPGEEGIDINFGAGFTKIQGVYEGGFRGQSRNAWQRKTKQQRFASDMIPVRRLAIDLNGETFGFRFAILLVSEGTVIEGKENVFIGWKDLEGKEYTPGASDNISFGGLVIRAVVTWKL